MVWGELLKIEILLNVDFGQLSSRVISPSLLVIVVLCLLSHDHTVRTIELILKEPCVHGR